MKLNSEKILCVIFPEPQTIAAIEAKEFAKCTTSIFYRPSICATNSESWIQFARRQQDNRMPTQSPIPSR